MHGQVVGSGTTRSKPNGSVSCTWLACICEDETQWEMTMILRHTVGKVAYRLYGVIVILAPYSVTNRHIFKEKSDGVESQPKYNAAPHKRNTGLPSLVRCICIRLHGNGVPIIPNRLSVMDLAIGSQSNRHHGHKTTVMKSKLCGDRGKWNSFCADLLLESEVC